MKVFELCTEILLSNVYDALVSYHCSNFNFFRWDVEMPAIIAKSIAILSDAGLGMAMFSLGMFQSVLVIFYVQ